MSFDEDYTWRLALYWFCNDPFGRAGWDVVRNAWYGMTTIGTNDQY